MTHRRGAECLGAKQARFENDGLDAQVGGLLGKRLDETWGQFKSATSLMLRFSDHGKLV